MQRFMGNRWGSWDPAPRLGSQCRVWCGTRQHSQLCDVPLSGAEPHVQGILSVPRAQLWWISSEDAPQVKWEDLLSHQSHPSPQFLKRSCALILSTEILHGIMQFLNYFISSFPLPPQERREPEGKTEGTFLFQPLWCVWKTILQQ